VELPVCPLTAFAGMQHSLVVAKAAVMPPPQQGNVDFLSPFGVVARIAEPKEPDRAMVVVVFVDVSMIDAGIDVPIKFDSEMMTIDKSIPISTTTRNFWAARKLATSQTDWRIE
jgi:hypothetical protein